MNWLGIVSSLYGCRLTWRGTRYRLHRNGQVDVISRIHPPADDTSNVGGDSARVGRAADLADANLPRPAGPTVRSSRTHRPASLSSASPDAH